MEAQHTESYFRRDMLPPTTPPAGQQGWVKWARENLFSSPLNAILTLVAGYAVIWLIIHLFPWFANSVWVANSQQECYDLGTGACFAVIRERWHQLMFGYYPSTLYWRPTLAFVLLLVALAPILFAGLPRKMLVFSAMYPGLMYFLIWGGSLWGPVMVYAGLLVGWGVYTLVLRRIGTLGALVAGVVAALVWWLFLAGPATGVFASVVGLEMEFVESTKLGGFLLSIVIGITGITCSLPLGVLLALGRKSDLLFLRTICIGFIEFIRGVPLITLLMVASFLLNIFLPPGTTFDIVLRVIIMVTLFASAYMAETIRGGLAAIPRGQFEAADAMGLNYWQAQRLIVLPQALKVSIPGIVNNFIGLFKDTTLVSIIGLADPLGFSDLIRGNAEWNGIVWELYGFVALIFFICCFGMSRYSQYLERKLRTGHH